MASTEGLTVYNLPARPPRLDSLGQFYITFAILWSLLLFGGMAYLVANRNSPIVRVRGLRLMLTAILFLHLYWFLGQLVYPIAPCLPVVVAYDIQYWVMGTWMPLGIALFHAFNTRFLHVAELQKQFLEDDTRSRRPSLEKSRSRFCPLGHMNVKDYSKRVLVYIGIGMVIQVFLTAVMWLVCRKYHPTFGAAGTELKSDTLPEQIAEMGRGWEWWASVVWQFVWTWMVAPMLLWKAWDIRDTLGWRVQTIGCCVSNLHATPMFLVATYSPAFTEINHYFFPSQWIMISIMMFEIFTIFVPCWEVLRQKVLKDKALQSNANCCTTKRKPEIARDWSSTSSLKSVRRGSSLKRAEVNETTGPWGLEQLTMSSLDLVLSENPGELQDFSASRDFSGENVAYLRAVVAWKELWPKQKKPDEAQLLSLYNAALDIYTRLVSDKDAPFPINLCADEGQYLVAMFEKAARSMYGEVVNNSILPFAAGGAQASGGDIELHKPSSSQGYTGEIPAEFTSSVFDSSFSEIKYLVFTNTWPKYVLARRNSSSTLSSGRQEV